MNSSRADGGYLPLDPPSDEDATRDAMSRLNDPEARLLDELFWFWPRQLGNHEDDGLKLLLKRRLNDAMDHWLEQERQSSAGRSSTHNLAVLYHAVALDLEHKSQGTKLTAKEAKIRDVCWHRAHKRWYRLLDDEVFWSRLTERIRDLDDPRLTTGLAWRIRDSLPDALLRVDAQLAVRAAERGAARSAQRHVKIMRNVGYDSARIDKALRNSLSQIRQRIKMICGSAEAKAEADHDHANQAAKEVLSATGPLLAVIDAVLPESDFMRQGAHDEAAQCALRCQVMYGNKTENWKESLELLKAILPLALGEAMRSRIQENIDIVTNNLKAGACFFCGQKADSDAAVEVAMYGNVERIVDYPHVRVTWNHGKIKVPRCRECKKNHGRITGWKGGFGFVGAVLGLCGFAVSGWVGVVSIIALAWIGAVVGESIGRSTVGYELKLEKEKVDHPAIQELRSQGWQFGERPANANG